MRRERTTKRTPADKVRRSFYTLALDWIDLHTRLPQPARTEQHLRISTRDYGHPAEWASDKAAQIAALFWSWHDMLAEHRNERRPLERAAEEVRVVGAWRYLEPRFEQLCELVDEEAFREITEIHFGIQRTLGRSQPVRTLPVPCPGVDCGLLTLQRRVAVGNDLVVCGSCGYTVRDDEKGENYRWLARVSLDVFLDRQIDEETSGESAEEGKRWGRG